MESAFWVQILDNAVCVSLRANTLKKGTNWLMFFCVCKATSLGEGKTLNSKKQYST